MSMDPEVPWDTEQMAREVAEGSTLFLSRSHTFLTTFYVMQNFFLLALSNCCLL